MADLRWLSLICAVSLATAAAPVRAQSAGADKSGAAETQSPVKIDLGATSGTGLGGGALGLRPADMGKGGFKLDLPFGLNYSPEGKSLMVPLDDKKTSGVGLGLDVGGSRAAEPMPGSGLGLQPKRAPGLIFQKKF